MKHLLTSVAVVAALALAAPVWAQVNPSGGNAQGLPGPNPGGPGLTPYSSGGTPAATPGRGLGPKSSGSNYIPPSAPPAAMAPSAAETTSAMPPSHRHARHVSHEKMAHHRGKTELSGSTANQLNQEELARLQAGNTGMPPAPPPPGPGAAQPMQPMGTTGGGAPYRP
jgi:hypothetical protein